MPTIDRRDLHGALAEPVLGSIGFLNEVMGRYPDAVSFAPGAPHPALLRELDLDRYVRRYLDHLGDDRGLEPDRARLLLAEYGPSRGLINDLLARALRLDQGLDVPERAIVVTVGAQEGMLLALRVLHRSTDDLLAAVTPCFPGVLGAARLLDIGVLPVHESPVGIDFDELAGVCRAARSVGRRVRTLYVAPDYSNPSGTVLDQPARLRLLAAARREDFLILEDGAYGFTAAPGAALPTLKSLDTDGRVIHLGTFAKVCLPGVRVGFVVADQPVRDTDGARGTGRLLADELAAAKTVVTVNTSPIGQAVVGGMLLEHGGSLAALGRERSVLYRRNLDLLLRALRRRLSPDAPGVPPGISWNRPTGGFFVRLRLPCPVDAELLEYSASRYGVLWTPMSAFHLDGAGDHELRLSCSYLDPDQIEEGVDRLARFLRDLPTAPSGGRRTRTAGAESVPRGRGTSGPVHASPGTAPIHPTPDTRPVAPAGPTSGQQR
ncbi:aminotransferase class I/II-fold pyridoxal phosphate-dependent enzyme [Kitasatospora sp. NPDC057015]|uniref:aminotransferase class I/II-fold pyridoxal phosphate-dependent enzyme n=1 Tax=Kitasatospora sp. NPDC057015 TaxID=3346001 RepID=UPI0036324718